MHHPIAEPYRGGLEAHTAIVCAQLASRGHDVTLFCKEGSKVVHPRVRVAEMMPASFVWTRGSSQGDDQRLDQATLRSCEQAAGHDVVLNNSLSPVPYWALPDAAMLTVLHTPATLERVHRVVQVSGWRPGARHRWVSVSEFNAAGWREWLDPVPVGVVHNGIDLSRWTATEAASPAAVWAARITPEKGLHVAIDAARAAGVGLRIAGPISDQGYFDEQIAPRLAIGGAGIPRIEYVHHLDHGQLPALLGDSSVFLATPLWDEPFGLAPLEAMGCGTPVAALRAGAMPELLGATGGELAEGPEDLPRAILRAAGMSRAQVRRRAEGFSVDVMVDRYEEMLLDLWRHESNPR